MLRCYKCEKLSTALDVVELEEAGWGLQPVGVFGSHGWCCKECIEVMGGEDYHYQLEERS